MIVDAPGLAGVLPREVAGLLQNCLVTLPLQVEAVALEVPLECSHAPALNTGGVVRACRRERSRGQQSRRIELLGRGHAPDLELGPAPDT